MSLDDISTELLLYFMLYGASAMVALIACIYLLFRKSNAISPEVTPPLRLRRWAFKQRMGQSVTVWMHENDL